MELIASNPKENKDGSIDIIWTHPDFGDIPFTATAYDTTTEGCDLFARAVAGEFGTIEPYQVPTPTLAESKASKAAQLNTACQAQIFAGYDSSALGAMHTYPAKQTDQSNMVASVTSSLYPNLAQDWQTPFWCADSNGTWAYRMHTAAQIQQAGADGKASILVALSKNAVLQAQASAATTLAQVDAVVW